MNILMLTNTFAPHVGGVARSVQRFASEFRRQRHRVLVVAPLFEGISAKEKEVLRIPAVQHFSGSDFSIPMPVPGRVDSVLKTFIPHIVHSHHPFLLGDTALRVAATQNVPVVFTHHTMYEKYTHYVPVNSPRFQRFVVEMVTGYCNLCDAVIAPSETVARLLVHRGVHVPVAIIPTGVNTEIFAAGDGAGFRRRFNIPPDAFVVGHVGRLAPEKNLEFLAEAVARFLLDNPQARFLVAGDGPSKDMIEKIFETRNLTARLHRAGILELTELAGAYRAMDVFAFASRTETQGMVLAEAMAAGVPVVALDAPGVREVVRDRENGRLLPAEAPEQFVRALCWMAALNPAARRRLKEDASKTAEAFSMSCVAERMLALYAFLIKAGPVHKSIDNSRWNSARRRIAKEWNIMCNIARAAGNGVLPLRRENFESLK